MGSALHLPVFTWTVPGPVPHELQNYINNNHWVYGKTDATSPEHQHGGLEQIQYDVPGLWKLAMASFGRWLGPPEDTDSYMRSHVRSVSVMKVAIPPPGSGHFRYTYRITWWDGASQIWVVLT